MFNPPAHPRPVQDGTDSLPDEAHRWAADLSVQMERWKATADEKYHGLSKNPTEPADQYRHRRGAKPRARVRLVDRQPRIRPSGENGESELKEWRLG
ncbi:uncharacterized protein SPSK_08182 [Sporothrix schenckii 1099-18]|uniref:Uncharacterized protein n=1 Tax=Sporothrix schenckii 1099-18 TaxID=1397361 RepID=A0A0F2MHZ6_SPOSC|nr:uncharacterized protein SPSK_08182 [Sporothrix schenckii 1099-18]KJR87801.1 hypothetical protein SPSK_08182 [Sporothrix schenckii 1099-18]